jgi:hypothetical protein
MQLLMGGRGLRLVKLRRGESKKRRRRRRRRRRRG